MRLLSILLIALLVLCMGCASGTDSPDTSESVAAPSADPLASPDTDAVDPSSTLERLQGTWQSVEDPAYVVEIKGEQFIESYSGTSPTVELMSISNECPERLSETSDDFFLVVADVCYVILDLTATTLSYSMVGGRGNTLAFERSDTF